MKTLFAAAMFSFVTIASAAPPLEEGGAPQPARRGEPGPLPSDGPEAPRGELREALRDYYQHLLFEELGIQPEKHAAVGAALEHVTETQRKSGMERRQLERQLITMVGEPREPIPSGLDEKLVRSLVQKSLAQDAASVRELDGARTALLAQLTPRQAAKFLAFEQVFRERVRRVVAERRERRNAEPGGSWGDTPPREASRPGRPARPPGGDSDRPFAEAPGRGPEGPPPGEGADVPEVDEDCMQDALETLQLRFAHETRMSLSLPRERAATLMPALDEIVAAHAMVLRDRLSSMRQLRRAGNAAEGSDAAAKTAVANALAGNARAASSVTTARDAVLHELSAVESARFLLLEQALQRDLGPRLRELMDCPGFSPIPGGRGPGAGARRPEGQGPGGRPQGRRPFPGGDDGAPPPPRQGEEPPRPR